MLRLKELFSIRKVGLKIAAFFMLFSLLSLGAIGIVGNYFLNEAYLYNVSTIENNLLEKKQEEIAGFYRDLVLTLQFQLFEGEGAEITSIRNFSIKSLHDLLRQIFEEKKDVILEAALIDENGNEVLKISHENIAVYERAIVAANGAAETDPVWYPRLNLESVGHLPEFDSVRNGGVYYGDIHESMLGLRARISVPLRNSKGMFIGVVGADVLVSRVSSIIENATLGALGYVYIVSRNGLVIDDSMNKFSGFYDMSRASIVRAVTRGMPRNGLGNEDQYINVFGDMVIASAKPMQNPDIGLVAEWPKSDAFAALEALRNQFILVLLYTAAALLVVGFLLSVRISRPINLLRKKAKEIGEGNFEQKIGIHTGDEFEDLGKSFEEMAKGLKELNELKDEFVFIATHELRSPVTVIRGYLSMLEEEKAKIPQELGEYIKKANMANERLVQLVNDLLEVARSQAGKMKIDVAPADIVPDVEYCINEVKPLADKRGITIVHEKFQSLPQAMTDSFRLKEVLINLLSNSIKYNKEKGTVTVSYEVYPHTFSLDNKSSEKHTSSSTAIDQRAKKIVGEGVGVKDGFLTIHVKDTGIGMSQEEVAKLFGKFYRAENKIVREIQGTGLGLFIVKNIVEKMGGKIWAASEWGNGTTFSFTLKIVDNNSDTTTNSNS